MTNIIILLLSLSTNQPATDFVGYDKDKPAWVVSRTLCATASLTFSGPSGTYEIWWRRSLQSFDEAIRIDDTVTVKDESKMEVKFPVLPGSESYFFLKLRP